MPRRKPNSVKVSCSAIKASNNQSVSFTALDEYLISNLESGGGNILKVHHLSRVEFSEMKHGLSLDTNIETS